VVGAYRVLAMIGEGGMGTVYLAEHTLLGRRAAIKVLRPSLSEDAEVVERFFNEARAVTQIADPGIVQIFDFGHHADRSAFIVMELLEGEPMDKRIERMGGLPLVDCLRFLRLICASLAVAHARGIVHRDLKPENLFIVRDSAVPGGERIKILDFGIAKLSRDQPGGFKTRTGVLLGTPAYMSPEQCRGSGELDPRSDIYALGCVVFAMVTGRPPFTGTAGELIAAQLLQPPPLVVSRIAGFPAVVDELLQRCLRKDPEERFSSMLELGAACDRADQMLSAAPTAAVEVPEVRAHRPSRVRPPSIASAHPTTLHTASGQRSELGSLGQPVRRRWTSGRVAGAVALVIASTVAVAVRCGDRPVSAPLAPAAGGHPPAEPSTSAAPTLPAATAAPTLPAATATAGDAAAHDATTPRDAGAADAPADAAAAEAPIDAAPPGPHRPSTAGGGPHPRSTRGDHASPTGSAAPIKVDRAD